MAKKQEILYFANLTSTAPVEVLRPSIGERMEINNIVISQLGVTAVDVHLYLNTSGTASYSLSQLIMHQETTHVAASLIQFPLGTGIVLTRSDSLGASVETASSANLLILGEKSLI